MTANDLRILFAKTPAGHSQVADFLDSIDGIAAAKCLNLLQRYASGTPKPGSFEKIHSSPNLWELRVVHMKQQYRLLFGIQGNCLVVCYAFQKKRMDIPRQYINQAVTNYKAFEEGDLSGT